MARVLITTRIFTANPVEEALDILREAGHEPVIASVPGAYLDGAGLHGQLAGISGAMASSEPYTAETFRMFPDLQVIARLGVGYDAIDLEAARDHEVPVMIAAGTNDTTVAESGGGDVAGTSAGPGPVFRNDVGRRLGSAADEPSCATRRLA